MTGTALSALLVVVDTGDLWWTLAPALFLAGVGGGGVISPNFTLTLAEVPPAMGGAAGGALQTGQRIGSALGAALLMTTYQFTLGIASAPVAARSALVAALVVLSVAFAMAVRSARHASTVPAASG
jgi:MFS family permease